MSSGRSNSSQNSGAPRITDDQITDLVSKLQQLIPELRNGRFNKASSSRILEETCSYIKNLQKEVDDLSDRLAQLLASKETDDDQAAIIKSLLM